jgi:peroxiredoxin
MTSDDPYAAINQVFDAVRDSDAPLNERLARLAEAVRAGAPGFAAAVEALIGRLATAGMGLGGPKVGEPLPPFLLPDATGRLVALTDLLARGPAVVFFYRGHWCPYCRLTSLAHARLQHAIGASHIAAITPETPPFNREFSAGSGLDYPVLTDFDCGYALSLDLAFWVDAAFADLMRGVGQDLAPFQAGAAWFLPVPATFVVNSQGMIVARHVDPDYRRRMDLDELLAAYQAAE